MRLYPTLDEPDLTMDDPDETSGKKLIMSNSIQLSIQPIASKIFSLEANCFVDFEGGGGGSGRSKSAPPATEVATLDGAALGSWGRTYSEGVLVERDGPQRQCRYKSYVRYFSERHYKETVFFQRRLVPHIFHTTLTVNGDGVGVATEELVEDAQPAARLHYFEQVCFKNKTVINRRAETVYNFPHEAHRRTVAKTTYHQDRKLRNYVSGIRVSAPSNRMLVVVGAPSADAESATTTTNGDGYHSAVEGTNGYGHHETDTADPLTQTDIRNGHTDTADSAKTVYSSVKEIVIS